MQRNALKNIGQAIAASAETKTIDELAAKGRKKFRVVNGKKVVQLIEAIVDDLISREAGDMAKRDRDSLVKQTQRKFDRVMKLQGEQESRLAQIREELRVAEEDRIRLASDKTFLEEQLEAARKSAPEGEAVRMLTRELGRVKGALQAIERKTSSIDGSSIERIVERLSDREVQLAQQFHDDLDDVHARLDSMVKDSENLRDAAVAAVFDKLVEQRAAWDDDLSNRIESRIGELGSRLEDLASRSSHREGRDDAELTAALSEIDDRIAAVEAASANLKEEAIAALLDRLADHEAGVEKGLVARVVIQLEALASQVKTMEEELIASRADAGTAVASHLGERMDAVESTLHEETRALRESVEEMRLLMAERESFSGEMVGGQIEASRTYLLDELTKRLDARETAMGESFMETLTDVRAAVDGLAGETAANIMTLRESLESSVDALRDETAPVAHPDLVDKLESKVLQPLKAELNDLRDDVSTRHSEALAAVAAADERGNALAERLEQLATTVTTLAERVDVNAEAQTRAMEALGDRIAEQAAASSSGFDTALESALDKITKTMEHATAKPIEISVEATDVLLNKIFDGGDAEMSSNLGQLDVEQHKSGAKISSNLGRLRAMRGKSPAKNGTE